jgi:hypothetical protein
MLRTTLAIVCSSILLAADPSAFKTGFEGPDGLAATTIEGQVTITAANPYAGTAALLLTRSKAEMEREKTSAVLPAFTVQPGIWDFSIALRSHLWSPDSSYNGTARIEVLDAAGTQIDRFELGICPGDKPWQAFRKRVELPETAVSARFTLRMEKTHGEFAADELQAVYAGPSLRTVTAIKFADEAMGKLFLPGQPLRFIVTAECTRPRPESERVVTCVVRDYWGAEQTPAQRIPLTTVGTTAKGRPAYGGVLDLSGAGLEQGRYFEIHAEMSEVELPEPAHDMTSFAVLPLATTKQYKPFDIPFTSSGWNPGVAGFFELSDRLGLRVANIYSSWKSQPPYECSAPGFERAKALGMGVLLRTPVPFVESRRPGWEAYDETALREGAKHMVETYGAQVPIAIRVGNEPHSVDEADTQRMISAYRAVYEGVKAADPTVIVTGTSCGTDETFFRNGYQQWHDVYDFHTYADAQALPGSFASYDRMVETYGQRKPIWCTEIGLNSQGMSRAAVASQMLKMIPTYFACGGANVSWFGINWPDPEGKNVGSNGESFDVFDSKYTLYAPKITAICEYNLVNGICIKQVVGRRDYPGGATAILFRDREGRCLLAVWKDASRQEVFLPLPGVGAVRAIRIDGASSMLDAGGTGLTLALTDDPYLLEFTSADVPLPAELGRPLVTTKDLPGVVKGGSVRVTLHCAGADPAAIALSAPPRWVVQREVSADGDVVFTVTTPVDTAAREGRLIAHLGAGAGELLLPLPVADPLEVRFQPVPLADGSAGMGLHLTNRGPAPQQVRWAVTFPDTFAMANGTFKLGEPAPFVPAFITPSAGELTLAPGAEASAEIRTANLDPHALYRARLEFSCDGKAGSRERLFGGCAGVARTAQPVAFDGRMGDPAWQHASIVTLDQAGQMALLNKKTASWDGPDDLSAGMRLLWDEQYLYVGMTVRDDIFSQPERDGKIWHGDGLQFLIDPCRASAVKPGRYDYAAARTADGVQAWCYSTADGAKAPTGEVKDFVFKATPTGERGDMVYELAIPWHRISPFVPAAGANLGLAMIVNEDDGQRRDSFMAWYGCAHSKQLSMNGDLVLLP